MARECQDTSLNLSVATKDANGSSVDSSRSRSSIEPQVAGGTPGMPRDPQEYDDDRQAPSEPSSDGQGGTASSSAADDRESREALGRHEAGLPTNTKTSPSSTSSSDSEPKDTEGGQSLSASLSMTKGKDLPGSLSPDRPISAKRRLWDVDRKEVEESLSREMKRIRQQESIVKSTKWNFDFERGVPLRGHWKWEQETDVPGFYQTKECSSKKRPSQKRFSPYERPATGSRPLPPEVPPPPSTLVTSACLSSSSSTAHSALPPAESSAFTKDYFRPGAKASTETVQEGTMAYPLQGTSRSPAVSSSSHSAEICAAATITCPSADIVATSSATTTTLQTTTVLSPTASLHSELSRENSKTELGSNGSSGGAAPSRFYPPSSIPPRKPDDTGGAEPSSSASPTTRTCKCKSPDKKKLKASQSASGSGTSSSGSGSGSSSSPSPLLKYYR